MKSRVAGKTDELLSPSFTRLKVGLKETRGKIVEIESEAAIFRKASMEYAAAIRRMTGVLDRAVKSKSVSSEEPAERLVALMDATARLADTCSADLQSRIQHAFDDVLSPEIERARVLKDGVYEAVAERQALAEKVSSLTASTQMTAAAQLGQAQQLFTASANKVASIQTQCETAMTNVDVVFLNLLRETCAQHSRAVSDSFKASSHAIDTTLQALQTSGALTAANTAAGSLIAASISAHFPTGSETSGGEGLVPLGRPTLLEGEVLVGQARSVVEESTGVCGVLVLTNYRIRFFSNDVYRTIFPVDDYDSRGVSSGAGATPSQWSTTLCHRQSFFDVSCDALPTTDGSISGAITTPGCSTFARRPYLAVPVLAVSRMEVLGPRKEMLVIRTTDERTEAWSFHQSDVFAHHVADKMKPHVWVAAPTFPFEYRLSVPHVQDTDGWKLFSFENELQRLLAQSGAKYAAAYKVSDANETYSLCPTYPSRFIVPSSLSDPIIRGSAKYRSKKRLPAIVWFHGTVTLSRASQPLAGILNARSAQDESYVAALRADASERTVGGEPCPLLSILDARPRMNALGNAAKGGGSESVSNYPGCDLAFLGIDNIHAVRDALHLLKQRIVKKYAQERQHSIISGAAHEMMARSQSNLEIGMLRPGNRSLSSGNSLAIPTSPPSGFGRTDSSGLPAAPEEGAVDPEAILEIDAALDNVIHGKDKLLELDAGDGGVINVDDDEVDADALDDVAEMAARRRDSSAGSPIAFETERGRGYSAVGVQDEVLTGADGVSGSPTPGAGPPTGLLGSLKRFASRAPDVFRREPSAYNITPQKSSDRLSHAYEAQAAGFAATPVHARPTVSSGAGTRGPLSPLGEEGFVAAIPALPADTPGWVRLVSILLAGGTRAAQRLASGTSVFVHCSDGWDRTAGLTTIAQLLLDPYYRTLKGFCLLIEKEWCSFGHRFAKRCGTGGSGNDRSDYKDDQRAPIFVQWVDTIWQIWRQMPGEFEFNENMLIALAEHVYSGRFGTFLYDCEKDRKAAHVYDRTVSMWSYILHPVYRMDFINPAFVAPVENTVSDASFRLGTHLLLPSPDSVVLWPYWISKWS
jgi:hypothetical protein